MADLTFGVTGGTGLVSPGSLIPDRAVGLSGWFGAAPSYDWLLVDRAARVINWSLAGIPGGIPNRTTIYTTLASGSSASQINTAISNCPTNQVVALAAGTFNISSTITMKSGVTLRGAGPGVTTINSTFNGNLITCYGSLDQVGAVGITAGNTKGSQTITLSNSSTFAAGHLVVVDELNDSSFVTTDGGEGPCTWCSRDDGARTLGECHIVSSKSGNDITLSNPLAYGYSHTPQAFIWSMSPIVDAGIENLTLHANSTSYTDAIGIDMICAARCWAYKVEFSGLPKKGIWMEACTMIESKRCYQHDPGNWGADHGYAISSQYQSSYSKFEDNIFVAMHAHIAFGSGGGTGNVAAYNYGHNCKHESANWFIHCYATHGAHTYMNLWEGNVMPKIGFDAIWGSGSHQLILRNNIRDANPGIAVNTNLAGIQMAAYQTNDSFVGNVLGYVGYGGTYDYVSDGAYCLWQFMSGTPPGLIRHGNYDYATLTTKWEESISGHGIPNSMYLASKPSWFGSLAWPPFGPDISGYINDIPAKRRWDNYQSSGVLADLFADTP